MMCIDFGAGYLQKTSYSKALSEIDSVDAALVVKRRWWYWPAAIVLVAGYYGGYYGYELPKIAATVQRAVVVLRFSAAASTLQSSVNSVQSEVNSTNPSVREEGLAQENAALSMFRASVGTSDFSRVGAGAVVDARIMITQSEALSRDITRAARDVSTISAESADDIKITAASITFNADEAALGHVLGVSVSGISVSA
jgi:hypothetical protein